MLENDTMKRILTDQYQDWVDFQKTYWKDSTNKGKTILDCFTAFAQSVGLDSAKTTKGKAALRQAQVRIINSCNPYIFLGVIDCAFYYSSLI